MQPAWHRREWLRILEPLRMLCECCDQRRAPILPAAPLLGFIAVSATIGSCADSDGAWLSCSVGWTCCLGSRLACSLLRAELTYECWQCSVTNNDVSGTGTSNRIRAVHPAFPAV